MTANEFDKHPELGNDFWGEHPDYPLQDWQYEVACDNTRLGYWDWVNHRLEPAVRGISMARYVMNEHGHFFVVELSIDEAKLSGCELYDTYDDLMDAVCRRHSLSREEVEACEYVVKDTKDGPAIFEDRGFSEPVAGSVEAAISQYIM